MDFQKLLAICVMAVFVNNYVLSRFLGLCPFIGVSKRTDAAFGMGMAVTFVMTMASVVTFLIYHYLLQAGDTNLLGRIFPAVRDNGLEPVLRTASYILVIASLVQLVEMFLRKTAPALYRALGIYLPLITTNCAVLGVALLNTTDNVWSRPLAVHEAAVQGFMAGVGFTVAMLLMSGIRERLERLPVPAALRGVPIAFICTGLMALSFLGFSGLVAAH
jgi:electron transport complex protein RnfA